MQYVPVEDEIGKKLIFLLIISRKRILICKIETLTYIDAGSRLYVVERDRANVPKEICMHSIC